VKSKLLNAGKELVRIRLKDFPDEEIFARQVTLAERIAYMQARSEDKPFGQHEMLYLSTFTADGRYYFESAQEAAQLAGRIADEILVKVLEASGISTAAEDDAEKKSESSPS